MSVVLETAYGRTRHDIELLNFLLANPNIAPGVAGNVSAGWMKQREKTVKGLLENIFRKSVKFHPLHVKGYTVIVHTPTGSMTIPPGFIDQMYFSTFPYSTSVVLQNSYGGMVGSYSNVGNPDFI